MQTWCKIFTIETSELAMVAGSVHKITLPAPKAVSPFIRTARWGLLLAGVLYGALRLKYLQVREVGIQRKNRAIMAKRKADYDQWMEYQAEQSMKQLLRESGME
ncbi:hypothetical protein EGR_01651 [Echinococcus granulosus]|uniref:ATP synthase F(0) complex subunit e, mitochondrial n=2 Tax=Echinococcus granulosus TaxID=6210 RepID=W6VA14_ECHGR|nr:hypothetical protein EGR_01651 [Echinococcus granulosus]EUB63569.1 hypothetical protein EGR_01651 [Echinococcus granulosus]